MKTSDGQMAACGHCGGRGAVQVAIWNPNIGGYQTLTETCLTCLGSGQVPR